MPRYAAWLKGPGGSFAVVHASKPITACGICQAQLSAYLCDYPVVAIGAPGTPGTCDAPLCDDCRVPQGPDVDYCPIHASDVSHPIELSDDIHVSDRSHPSQMAHVTDERGQEYLL